MEHTLVQLQHNLWSDCPPPQSLDNNQARTKVNPPLMCHPSTDLPPHPQQACHPPCWHTNDPHTVSPPMLHPPTPMPPHPKLSCQPHWLQPRIQSQSFWTSYITGASRLNNQKQFPSHDHKHLQTTARTKLHPFPQEHTAPRTHMISTTNMISTPMHISSRSFSFAVSPPGVHPPSFYPPPPQSFHLHTQFHPPCQPWTSDERRWMQDVSMKKPAHEKTAKIDQQDIVLNILSTVDFILFLKQPKR